MHGQYLPMLIVDYIAIGLLLYAWYISRNNTLFSLVLFVGAWGFTFYLFYRALFSRLASVQSSAELNYLTLGYITTFMIVSVVLFISGIVSAHKEIT